MRTATQAGYWKYLKEHGNTQPHHARIVAEEINVEWLPMLRFDPALEAAYLATDYWVEDAPNGPFAIRIGEISVDLEELLVEAVAVEWAYATACNPRSIPLSNRANARRMGELHRLLAEGGWRFYSGVAVGRDGLWREQSVLILGLPEADAIELALRLDQNAIVAGRFSEAARLVWTG